MVVFAAIIAAALLGMIVYLLYSALKDGWYLLMYRIGLQRLFIKTSEIERITQYLQNFTYYKNLSEEGKKKFVNRLLTFMLNKEFVGGAGMFVTEEMRVLISASAIQLTFGLSKYKLESLETIVVYPDTFFLHKRSPEYKGATKGHKMFLSWKSFQEGYAKSDDNLNLGLHEMTHALKLTLNIGRRYDKLFADRMGYWENMVSEKFNGNQQKFSFLRTYANANTEEFFDVCVEAFFENPDKFQKELPEIFHLLTFLLNQNIQNKSNDYIVDKTHFNNNMYNIPLAHEVKRSNKYNTNHWSIFLLIIGCIGAFPTFFFLMNYFMLPYIGYFLMLFILGTIGLLQKRYFYERDILTGKFFIFYCYGGFGATILSLLLWLNYLVPVSDTRSEKYIITSYEAEYSTGKRGKKFIGWRVEVEDEFQLNNQLLTFGSKPQNNEKYLVLNYRYGIIGIKKVESYNYTDE